MSEVLTRKMGIEGVLTAQHVRTKRNLRDMRFIFVSVLAAFIAVVIVFAFLWSRLASVNAGYEISRANSVRSALIEKNRRLKIEFMKLKSPERIEKIASEELMLVRPTGGQIVNIK